MVFLRLKSWDLASMLRLAKTSGPWDLGPHVNWPSYKQTIFILSNEKLFVERVSTTHGTSLLT